MVAEPRVWVDIEPAVRAWLRDAVTSAGDRVFMSFNEKAAMPQASVERIAGPDDACLMQLSAWGAHKADAAQLAAELATVADALGRYAHDGVVLLGARVEDVRNLPDVESDTPRYVVDVTITAIAG